MPKVDRWARLTVRLPAESYHRLETLAEEIPGMTPNALIRLAVEQLMPQLETMAHALKAARSGDQHNALELFAALTQATRRQARRPADTPDAPGQSSPQTTLTQMHALQQEQGQRVQAVLDQPQGRAMRHALERIQLLQEEQLRRVQDLATQPQDDFQAGLEWIQALQNEQDRWLQNILTQPHGQPLRQALDQIQALQWEQGQYVQAALEELQTLQQHRPALTARGTTATPDGMLAP